MYQSKGLSQISDRISSVCSCSKILLQNNPNSVKLDFLERGDIITGPIFSDLVPSYGSCNLCKLGFKSNTEEREK